jgi:hypothetical protein
MDESSEIKITFKHLQHYLNGQDISNKMKNNKDYNVSFNINNIYDHLESCNPPRIINIKLCFFSYLQKENKDESLGISLDCIILYELINNKYKLLNDSDIYNEDKNGNNIIYYNFNEDKINIKIEFFSKCIDNFYFNLSEMCSIFMIKYLIYLKLKNIEAINNFKTLQVKKDNINDINSNDTDNNNEDEDNLSYNFIIKINEIENVIKLYGNGIINKLNQGYNNKNETNRHLFNDSLLVNVLNYYLSFSRNSIYYNDNFDKKNTIIKKTNEINLNINQNKISLFNNTSEYTLSFIMTEVKKDKLVLGLDFRFNLLNYFSPYYIEEENKYLTKNKKFINNNKILLYNGGGLKLFLYCLNSKCIYNSKYFVQHLGYGHFDIFKAMNIVSCPLCRKKGKKAIELKYIGMINAKWVYKGFLTGLKFSNVEGQGITILNDVIYRTNEIVFSQQFISLNFIIEKYISKNQIIKEEKQKVFTSINTTFFTDNSNSILSNKTEEEDSKIDNNTININIEKNKTIPINLMKNRVKRRYKKKFQRNITSLEGHPKNKTISNSSKCEINDLVINNKNNNSCWSTCFDEDKKDDNNDCLIF